MSDALKKGIIDKEDVSKIITGKLRSKEFEGRTYSFGRRDRKSARSLTASAPAFDKRAREFDETYTSLIEDRRGYHYFTENGKLKAAVFFGHKGSVTSDELFRTMDETDHGNTLAGIREKVPDAIFHELGAMTEEQVQPKGGDQNVGTEQQDGQTQPSEEDEEACEQ
jgi:hypothetical protein